MIDTFELIEIDTAETMEELCHKEIEYIKKYDSYYLNNKGYNMTFGGQEQVVMNIQKKTNKRGKNEKILRK